MPAQRHLLPDGRWHFQHGPIDLVIGAEGSANAVAAAHAGAWQRFGPVLDELVAELPALRRPVAAGPCPVQGGIARRMWQACQPLSMSTRHRSTDATRQAGLGRLGAARRRPSGQFITPMAAVAGAVAQELIACYQRDGIQRAWVNNGGDIALHLAPGHSVRIGVFADLARLDARQVMNGLAIDGHFEITHELPVRGVATSGWRGRSFSLGIADSVTVLARSAAEADAAATVIANAVNLDDPRILRRPAHELKDDSDLGSIPVTVDVPPLGHAAVQCALQAGLLRAEALQGAGLIWAALLVCQGQAVSTRSPVPRPAELGSVLGSVFA